MSDSISSDTPLPNGGVNSQHTKRFRPSAKKQLSAELRYECEDEFESNGHMTGADWNGDEAIGIVDDATDYDDGDAANIELDDDGDYRQPFPVQYLPPVIARFVLSVSKAIGCHVSFVVLPLLACLARAIGNRRVVQLKPTWNEPAIIWGVVIGESGTHKSPARRYALHFLRRQEETARQKYADEMKAYEPQKARYEVRFKAWNKSKAEDPPPIPPEEPVRERFVVDDITVEAAAMLLRNQFDGLLIAPDEMNSWLGSFGKYKHGGSDKSQWLDAWAGDPWIVDRKTGAHTTIDVPRASVSVVGGVQPDVLRRVLTDEFLANGLAARLLVVFPKSGQREWTEDVVEPVVEAKMGRMFEKLFSLPPAQHQGVIVPEAIPLSPEAKEMWVENFNDRGEVMQYLDSALRAAFSKLEAYTARFALIFQLSSWAAGESGFSNDQIIGKSMLRAIEVVSWFEDEARSVYQRLNESDATVEERKLIALIRRRGGDITPRELQQASRAYRGEKKAEEALNALETAKLGYWTFRPPSTESCLRLE